MRMLDTRAIDTHDRIMILAQHTARPKLLLCGFFAGVGLDMILGGLLLLLHDLKPGSLPFLLDTPEAILFAVVIALFGATHAWISTTIFALEWSRQRGAGHFRMNFRFVESIFPLVSFALSATLLFLTRLVPEQDCAASIILHIVMAIFMAILMEEFWGYIFRHVLVLLSPVDWRLAVDKERFTQALRTRFDESRRYGIPLSLLVIGIDDFAVLKRSLSRRAITRLQEELIRHIDSAMRTVDSVARLESGQCIGILLHAPEEGTTIAADRLLEQLTGLSWRASRSQSLTPRLVRSIASWSPAMQHERELYELALKGLPESVFRT
ncbi:MAG TPA: hypothetical protein PLM00_04690 [Spirochaetota bacterium]|nr:hypothetical protein [Spirochaetota bacterium]HPH03467.1 hypothetical protein [Spirochaetota bacterium]HPN82664.1 hypothetical protein [Spirochaetota bacterium]